MAIKTIIKKNTYFDSVSLMTLTSKANTIKGVENVNIAMGTSLNKDVLKNTGLLQKEAEDAKPGDLIIVIEADEAENMDELLIKVEESMIRKENSGEAKEVTYSSVEAAVKNHKDAGLAIISVPGIYAARVAGKALREGLNVMIFSDNVTVEEEIALKTEAHEKGLLVMGPDCGTAILNGKGLCFANEVRPGNIGIVAASGTGAQEMSVRIHDFGGGVSQLIGTGGRDLSKEVGGIMMLDGIQVLMEDEKTEVIVLLSKPPAKEVANKIYDAIRDSKKPVIICFIGGNQEEIEASGATYGKTTKRAALAAVIASGVEEDTIDLHSLNMPLIDEIKAKLSPEQKYIRGLFTGGTLCSEVSYLVSEKYQEVYSNITKDTAYKIGPSDKSKKHTFIDLGDDSFTQGRPHPMIDPSLRLDRIIEEAKDPEVGVLVMDFVLGYGAHMDPVGVTLPAIKQAKEIARKAGRHLEILAFALGTELDPQVLDNQIDMLTAEGVTIASSSENTGLLSRGFVEKEDK